MPSLVSPQRKKKYAFINIPLFFNNNNLADIISAGTDTIGVTLWWNLYLMCHYQTCQKTAANEVDQFIKQNGRLPQFSERTELPYLLSVMKECMRFRPTMQFGLPHATQEESKIIIIKRNEITQHLY